jgi:CRP-like cAMP-binding protein
MTSTLQSVLEKHPFLEGIRPDLLALLTGCAKNRRFEAGEYLTREDEEADRLFLLRSGRVALRVRGSRAGALTILTIGPGEMVGWSWLVAPHRYRFDAQALETTPAFEIDGRCLRTKCDENPELGYEILRRVSVALARRLDGLHLQLLDVYWRGDET